MRAVRTVAVRGGALPPRRHPDRRRGLCKSQPRERRGQGARGKREPLARRLHTRRSRCCDRRGRAAEMARRPAHHAPLRGSPCQRYSAEEERGRREGSQRPSAPLGLGQHFICEFNKRNPLSRSTADAVRVDGARSFTPTSSRGPAHSLLSFGALNSIYRAPRRDRRAARATPSSNRGPSASPRQPRLGTRYRQACALFRTPAPQPPQPPAQAHPAPLHARVGRLEQARCSHGEPPRRTVPGEMQPP